MGAEVENHSCREHEGALDIPRPDEAYKASRFCSLRKERCIKYWRLSVLRTISVS